ncbi:MAG: AAA family ATPase [Microcoleus sp.]
MSDRLCSCPSPVDLFHQVQNREDFLVMPKFKIEEFVEFDTKGRAICPACSLSKGSGYSQKNLSLVGDSGAYKCHRGCSPEEIRAALNQPIDRQIPTAIANAPKTNSTVNPQTIKAAHEALLKNNEAMGWLDDRGIDRAAVVRHKLGLTRSKQGSNHIPAVTIPIPANEAGTQYYQKKRIAPWRTDDRPTEWSAWSQYGIPQMVYFTHKPAGAIETWLCEGEWDAIRLAMEMRHSTTIAIACFTCGAGNVPPQEQLDRLPGKITILYDLDEPGKKGALKVQDRLRERAFIAAIDGEGHPEGWDVSDVLNSIGLEPLEKAIAIAKPWIAPLKPNALRDRLSTNDELLARAADHTEWLIPDILTPNELFIMAAPPRTGKSLFCMTLAKAIATGSKFLDRPSTQGSVLYVNLEDSETKIKTRQIAQKWSEGMPVYWLDKFKLSELDDLKALIAELGDIRLLILDTFARVRDDKEKETSSEMGRVIEPLQEMARDMGLCILLTHHTRKITAEGTGEDCDPFDLIRGNTAIRGAVRGSIVILPTEGAYRIITENGYTERNDLRARIDPATLEWKLLGQWSPRIDGSMKEQVIDYLNLHGGGTVKQIATDLGFQASSVGTCLSKLQAEDFVTKQAGKGRTPATYTRSFNLLQHVEASVETYNPVPVSDTALLQRFPKDGVLPEKVIISDESDQDLDHFSDPNSLFPEPLKQSCNPDTASDVCFNAQEGALKQIEATKLTKRKGRIEIGSLVRYIGQGSKSRICSGKKLTVLSIADGSAEVTHDDWYVTQTIPLADLRLTN